MGGREEPHSKGPEVMITIFPCNDRFDDLVQFVARLNSDGTHHIGFFGEGEADIRASLAECLIPPAEGFMMAYDDDQLVGVFGVDANPEISRAWLFGPLVEHTDWHFVADKLYESVLPCIPADIHDYDLFCDVQNVHVDEFAARHGFPLRSENAILTLVREKYTPSAKRISQVSFYEDDMFSQFEDLHNVLFPKTYFTARQIVEKLDRKHKLFLLVEDEQLLGYHFCKIEPESESGYVDFIGTDASARRRGIAAGLLASGVDWMLSTASTKKISLTVNADNAAALKLYKKYGFVTERVMRGYRKHNE
jgi:ribosomal protein S18 acetylase RimI-like enzyme